MAHDHSKGSATPSPNGRLRTRTGRSVRVARAWFDSWSLVGGTLAVEDFVRRAARQPLVGPHLVVPSNVVAREHDDGAKRQRNESPPRSEGLVLERSPEAFDASDGSVLADGPVAGRDAVTLAPSAVDTLELRAMVRDGVPGRCPGAAAKKLPDVGETSA